LNFRKLTAENAEDAEINQLKIKRRPFAMLGVTSLGRNPELKVEIATHHSVMLAMTLNKGNVKRRKD